MFLLGGAGLGPRLFLSFLSLGPHAQRSQSWSQTQKKLPRGSLCSPVDWTCAPAEGSRTPFPCLQRLIPARSCLPLGSAGIWRGPGRVHALRTKFPRACEGSQPSLTPLSSSSLQPRPCRSSTQSFPHFHLSHCSRSLFLRSPRFPASILTKTAFPSCPPPLSSMGGFNKWQ